MADSMQDTVELAPAARFVDTFFTDATNVCPLRFGAATHCGNVRANNEDQYAVIERSRHTQMLLTSLLPEECGFPAESTYTLAVADGIGGAKSGEVASRVTLLTVLELASHATSWVMRVTDPEAQQLRERVDAYLERIQKTLRSLSRSDPKLAGMGTTWTSAHIFPEQAIIVHLGDSRAYRFHDGELLQITHDETVMQSMLDSGMDPHDAERYRHVLTNSLGGRHHEVSSQIHEIDFAPDDQLLLCTDGLTDMLSDEEIAGELRQHETPQAACDALVQKALDAGGRDNITVVIAAAQT
jgi:protein phosphatase